MQAQLCGCSRLSAPAPFRGVRCNRSRSNRPVQIRASMVSKDNLPEQYRDEKKFRLQFVCFTRLAPEQTTAALQAALPEHKEWLQKLDKGDKLAFHGQFLNPEAVNYGSGMYAVYADCTEQAKEIASQDPLHQAGIRRFEMLPWVQQCEW